jgi:hypothetical protein
MANDSVSTNTNSSSNKTTQDKTKNNKIKNKKQRKKDQLRLFTLQQDFLKISVHIQTAFAAATYIAERQWPKKKLNVVQLYIFRVGT